MGNPQDKFSVEETLFQAPSDKARGVVVVFATLTLKGKPVEQRVAHATLLVNEPPSTRVNVPQGVALHDLPVVTAALEAFRAKVTELDAS